MKIAKIIIFHSSTSKTVRLADEQGGGGGDTGGGFEVSVSVFWSNALITRSANVLFTLYSSFIDFTNPKCKSRLIICMSTTVSDYLDVF